ncbi:S8 family peptidase [Paenibacillus lutrae]|uniref:S8 family serine peptidase n=1 Tax=Paenibacillus lutrae TaxID=2078573 RepID=A0A7X3FMV4_9BACL|nr:S8 family peptidase [Paenibacillus lutrae]MVP02532.1 S8 family serine peptidase [Paenibacillus lutrae]
MDSIKWLEMLHAEIQASEGRRKYIILFQSHRDYKNISNLIGLHIHSLPGLSAVQDLKLIHAISCPVRSYSDLAKHPAILSIEEDSAVNIQLVPRKKARTSDDSDTSYESTQIIPWGVQQIKAPDAWKKSKGSRVSVGVIDTGIDFYHPDLQASVARGINILNRHQLPIDDNGHGTHIAGTIAAAGKRMGIMGVAPKAVIHAVKAFDMNGSAYVSDIVAGIDWCVRNDLDVINMSFGMRTYSQALEDAVTNAYQAGTVVVASSGNDGKSAQIDYPARFSNVFSVGATTKTNKVAPFSNQGKRIDIYAPGESIYSCWLQGKYNELSGTSMATAHVSGVIALMLSVRARLRPNQIKQILRRSSTPLKKSKSADTDAPGLIHARRAVASLLKTNKS